MVQPHVRLERVKGSFDEEAFSEHDLIHEGQDLPLNKNLDSQSYSSVNLLNPKNLDLIQN